jgi:hypothetical protein
MGVFLYRQFTETVGKKKLCLYHFLTKFWESHCLENKNRCPLCYDAMTLFVYSWKLIVSQVSNHQITGSIMNNEFQWIMKETFVNWSSWYPGVCIEESQLRQPQLLLKINLAPFKTILKGVTFTKPAHVMSSILLLLWTSSRYTSRCGRLSLEPSATHMLYAALLQTFSLTGHETEDRSQHSSQHYDGTCCLGLRVRRWPKGFNTQVPAEGQICRIWVPLCWQL